MEAAARAAGQDSETSTQPGVPPRDARTHMGNRHLLTNDAETAAPAAVPPATAAAGSEAAGAAGAADDAADAVLSRRSTRRNPRHARRSQESSTERGAQNEAAAASAPVSRREARANADTTDSTDYHGATAHPNGRFPGLVGWTTLGTIIPGLGLLHKNKKSVWGWILLLGFLITIMGGLVWLIAKGPTKAIAGVAGSPSDLNVIAVILPILALIYIFDILLSYFSLRRGRVLTASRKVMGGVLVASLIVIAGVPMGIGSYYSRITASTLSDVFGSVGTGPIQDKASLWENKSHINVFLIGRDSSDTRQGTRPDTMMVASIDTKSGNTTLLSIPRNLAFPIFPKGSKLAKRWPNGFAPDGHNSDTDLINAVWDWIDGEKDQWKDQKTDGMPLGQWATMQAVEGSTGLSMDYWASVNMAGFEDVVNAIGGVKIDVERPIPIGGGHNLATGGLYPVKGWINPGEQKLTGSKALWYVRSRWLSDNYDRMCRQQRMIKTIVSQIDPQTITVSYPKLLKAAGDNVKTDIPTNDLPAFIELTAAMQGATIKSAQINNSVILTYNPDYDKLKKWIKKQLDPEATSQQEEVEGVDSSGLYKSTDSPTDGSASAPDDEPTDEASDAAEPTSKAKGSAKKSTPAHATDGLEDAEGKCYPASSGRPKGYDWTKDGWPGKD